MNIFPIRGSGSPAAGPAPAAARPRGGAARCARLAPGLPALVCTAPARQARRVVGAAGGVRWPLSGHRGADQEFTWRGSPSKNMRHMCMTRRFCVFYCGFCFVFILLRREVVKHMKCVSGADVAGGAPGAHPAGGWWRTSTLQLR